VRQNIRVFALSILLVAVTVATLGSLAASRLKSLREKDHRIVSQLKTQIEQDNIQIANQQQRINNISRQRDELFISAYQREEVALGPDDIYENLDGGNFSANDTTDRVDVNCKNSIHHKNAAIILTLGQSNAANTVNRRVALNFNILNFDLFNGKCYVAQEPLIGPTNYGGNFVTRLASKLVDRGAFQVVILAPIAVGGTKVQDWAVGGFLNRRLVVMIKRLHDAGLQPTHVLWHQGEANIEDDPRDYIKYFMSVFATIRRNGVYAPIFVAQATICGGKDYEFLRSAQHEVVDRSKGILAGPNTDEIGLEKRYDTCHFSADGAETHAEMWYKVLESN
jgi:hypothetical protein